MLKTLALTTWLGLILAAPLATPSLAETYTDPDSAWWGAFLETLDGTAPDLEALALQDPEYLAADEFSRDEARTKVMARLAADRANIDPATAEVVLSIRAEFGDYDSARGGFPVSIFTPTSRLPLSMGRSLFFRNWQDVALFPATRDEGRALRQKIGQDSLLALVTVRDIRKSQTRSGGYEGHVASVIFSTTRGSEIGQITPPDAIAADPDAVVAQTEAARQTILTAAGIPPLGTRWDDAKQHLQPLWPVMASSDFVNWGTAKRVAYFWKDGAVQQDEAHDPAKGFRLYLQQREAGWMPQDGEHISVTDLLYGSGASAVDTRGLGPGLACYTPEVFDRCAVLIFEPKDGSHVLTGAYGVIEQPAATSAEAAFTTFLGDAAGAFDGLTTIADYDREDIRQARKAPITGGRGVPTFAAGAGQPLTANLPYDPLKNTTGIEAIQREIAIYAIEGAEGRTPVVYVIGQ